MLTKVATIVPIAAKGIASAVVLGGAAFFGKTVHHNYDADPVEKHLAGDDLATYEQALATANAHLQSSGLATDLRVASGSEKTERVANDVWACVFATASRKAPHLATPDSLEPGYIAVPRLERGRLIFQLSRAAAAAQTYDEVPARRSVLSI